MINKYQGRLWLNEQPKHQNPKVMQKDTEKSRKNIIKKIFRPRHKREIYLNITSLIDKLPQKTYLQTKPCIGSPTSKNGFPLQIKHDYIKTYNN